MTGPGQLARALSFSLQLRNAGHVVRPIQQVRQMTTLPLFYHRVVTLDRTAHAALRLNTAGGFNFAAGTNAIPLSLSELAVAAVDHPIVFAGQGLPMPLAVVGYRHAENLCIEADGSWRPGAYVPAYLRTYPFILVQPQAEATELLLGIEMNSPLVGETKGTLLFEEGEPSALVKERMALVQAYHQDMQATRRFAEALEAAELLVPQEARLDFRSGGSARIDGFRMLDGAKVNALPEEKVLEFWRNGWIGAIFAAVHSQPRWAGLLERAEARRTAEAA
jgi:hypothetical protein